MHLGVGVKLEGQVHLGVGVEGLVHLGVGMEVEELTSPFKSRGGGGGTDKSI
jgi:hypothetical protein